jgi:hypothetical protein
MLRVFLCALALSHASAARTGVQEVGTTYQLGKFPYLEGGGTRLRLRNVSTVIKCIFASFVHLLVLAASPNIAGKRVHGRLRFSPEVQLRYLHRRYY